MYKPYPRFDVRKVISLDGPWDFTFLGDVPAESINPKGISYYETLPVPSAFDAFPKYAGKRGVALFRTKIDALPFTR